jgi:hypothetical protein
VAASQTIKRRRYLRQIATRKSLDPSRAKPEPTERQVALRAAASERDKQLGQLGVDYGRRIYELYNEWAEKRKAVWEGYEEQRNLILQAAMLKAKAE